MLNFFLYHRLPLTLALLVIGLLVAWRFWRHLGLKSLCAYYLLRTCWFYLGCLLIPDLIPGDIPGWYLHAGWMVDSGCVPGKDFLSPYNIGFNCLLAVTKLAVGSQLAIAIPFALAEFVGCIFFYRAISNLYNRMVAKRSLILFLTSSVCFASAMGAQDETLIFLGCSSALYFSVRRQERRCQAALLLSFFFTKVLSVVYLMPFILLGRRRRTFIFFGIVLAVFVALYIFGIAPVCLRFGRVLGMDVASDRVAKMQTSGNIWFMFEGVSLLLKYGIGFFVAAVVAAMFSGRVVDDEKDDRNRVLSVMYGMLVFVSVFYVLIPGCWMCYMLPIIPFAYVLALSSESNFRHKLIVPVVSLWTWLLTYSRISIQGGKYSGGICLAFAGLYFLVYGIVLTWMMVATFEFWTTPWNGVVKIWQMMFCSGSDTKRTVGK